MGYYRPYLRDFATDEKPLNQLTTKGIQWNWDGDAQQALVNMKERLTTVPVLGYPGPNQSHPLDTDASGVGVGHVFSQVQVREERVIYYYNKTPDSPRKELRRYLEGTTCRGRGS